ncbi:MAG: hypothetical protein OXU25_04000 [Thaumarchaeota archaeon]|nr:hypothetical protein [Nitrososphaerota archaeon]
MGATATPEDYDAAGPIEFYADPARVPGHAALCPSPGHGGPSGAGAAGGPHP